MQIYREQAFQKLKPHVLENGQRGPFVDMPLQVMNRIQRGTMYHHWKGVMCNKNPFDLTLYAQLLWELKPRTIIEIGYKFGGSALWFADQADAMGLDTRLFCIDVEQREQYSDPRITFVEGNGRDLGKTLTDEVIAELPKPWLIVEDADHHYTTCLKVLEFFAPRMQAGDYLCMEDGLADTSGNAWKGEGGPNRALYDFFAAYPHIYEVDAHYCDYFGNNVTWCTNGWLRRGSVKAPEKVDTLAQLEHDGISATKLNSTEETVVAAAEWSLKMGDFRGAIVRLTQLAESSEAAHPHVEAILAAAKSMQKIAKSDPSAEVAKPEAPASVAADPASAQNDPKPVHADATIEQREAESLPERILKKLRGN